MPVIAVVNQKGGVGKTTLATNLASALAGTGQVVILDADLQASATGWAGLNLQKRLSPVVRGVDARNLVREVRAAAAKSAWVIVDCPPGISRVNADAIRVADLVLVPCKARVWDLWACEDIVDAIKLRQAANRGYPRAAFVISMGRPGTRFSKSIAEALAKLDLPVLESRTTERESYAVAAATGISVLEGSDRVARAQIMDIHYEVKEMLK